MNAGQGTTVVKAGTELAQKAGEINAELGQSVGEAAQAARAIAASTHQQNAGMDQIAQAKSETSQNTTQFVTGAQETQSAIGGLSELARQLEDLAGHFQLSSDNRASPMHQETEQEPHQPVA